MILRASSTIKFIKTHFIFFVTLGIFLILLFRDPFSTRTLIPNLEPYPDTIHYVNPALSLISGEGLKITREGRGIYPSVPPLYSLALIPVYALFGDPRMFYFTNIILSIISFILFYAILRKLFKNVWIIGLCLFLFATNYFLYWYPVLAMAENLLMTLFIGGVYLLLVKPDPKRALIAGIIAASFFGTKYASIAVAFLYFLAYGVHAFLSISSKKQKWKLIVILGCSFLLSFAAVVFYEVLIAQNTFESTILSFIRLLSFAKTPASLEIVGKVARTSWFSMAYLQENLPAYLYALTGKSARYLWDSTPIVPRFIAIPALLGLLASLFAGRRRLFTLYLWILLLPSILFISFFYSVDMRYINHAIPILLIGFGLFLNGLYMIFKGRKLTIVFIGIVMLFFGVYSLSSYKRLRTQVAINLKYAETPWYYISVLKLNEYFNKPASYEKRPNVISSMPPYYIDFFANGNYRLLPLHKDQEFRGAREEAWGPNDYSDLPRLYENYLKKGRILYIHNYGLGNEKYLQSAFAAVGEKFKLTLVHEGCYNACNIWRVELKKPRGSTFL